MMIHEWSIVVVPIAGLSIAAWGLWVAAKQLVGANVQAKVALNQSALADLQATYGARISTMTATIADLERQVSALEVQVRLNAQHAERCEEALQQLRHQMGHS